MERNGQLLRFALCLFKIKIECNDDGITFWLWVVLDEKREGKSREEKFFILWRGSGAGWLRYFWTFFIRHRNRRISPESQSPHTNS